MENELKHYGVLGMHWGRRNPAKYQKKINGAQFRRKQNKSEYEIMKKESNEKYRDKSPKKLAKSLAGDKALFDTTEIINKYKIAKNKAKMNPEYKNSEEYKRAKIDNSKTLGQMRIYGTYGHQRIETLKNLGYSEKKAKISTLAQEFIAGLAMGGTMITATYLAAK